MSFRWYSALHKKLDAIPSNPPKPPKERSLWIPTYYPTDPGRYKGSIGWGPVSTHWQNNDSKRHRRHCIIWDWEPRACTIGFDWYSNGDHPNETYRSATLWLPFFRIWYKYEGVGKWAWGRRAP